MPRNLGELLYLRSTEMRGHWVPAEALFEDPPEEPWLVMPPPPRPMGECKNGHELTEDTVYLHKPSAEAPAIWRCMTCRRVADRAYKERKKLQRLQSTQAETTAPTEALSGS